MRCWYLVLGWLLAAGSPAGGQDARVERDILERIEAVRSFELPRDFEIVFEALSKQLPVDPEFVRRLERQAETDRIARRQLTRLRMQDEAGGLLQRISVFYDGPERWRINSETLTDDPRGFADAVRDGGEYWQLAGTQGPLQAQLQHGPVRRARPGFDLRGRPEFVRVVMGRLATGASGMQRPGEPVVEEAVREGDEFRAAVRLGPRRFEIEGRYGVPAGDAGAGERMLIGTVRTYADGRYASMSEYSGWVWVEELGLLLAGESRLSLRDGTVQTAHRLLHAGRLDEDMQALTRRPEPGGEDEVRGPEPFLSLIDHERGRRMIVDPLTGGLVPEDGSSGRLSAAGRPVVAAMMFVVAAAVFVLARRGSSGLGNS